MVINTLFMKNEEQINTDYSFTIHLNRFSFRSIISSGAYIMYSISQNNLTVSSAVFVMNTSVLVSVVVVN